MLNLSAKAQKNPGALLVFLLIAHLVTVSLNRAPYHSDGTRYVQVWVMTALAPIQWVMAQIASTTGYSLNHYLLLRDARFENDRLRAELADLQAKLVETQQQARLADQLRAFSHWQETKKVQMTLARVIARDANQWFNSVVIDRGTLSGIQKDQPVVTPEGLVGRVIYAGPISSRVLLLTDERHGAGAIIGQLAESRVLGIVKGKNALRCEMKFVATPEEIKPDEVVITSGQDRIYPRGLVIGRIKLSGEESSASGSVVEVEPTVALDRLDVVAVLMISPEQTRAQVNDLIKAERKKEHEKQAPPARRQQ